MNANAALRPGQILPAPPAAIAPLHVVVISGHPTLARAANQLLDNMMRQLAPDVEAHCDQWSFAELENKQFQSEALELASACDMLAIAVGEEDLEGHVSDWLKEWIRRRSPKETALVLCSPQGIPLYLLPRFAGLPNLARGDGLSCFTTALSLPHDLIPPALHPKSLLARMAAMDSQTLPEESGLND